MNQSIEASKIESENKRFKKTKTQIKSKCKDDNDTRACKCLICGIRLDILTHCHAAKHGYPDKRVMIKDKKIKWL